MFCSTGAVAQGKKHKKTMKMCFLSSVQIWNHLHENDCSLQLIVSAGPMLWTPHLACLPFIPIFKYCSNQRIWRLLAPKKKKKKPHTHTRNVLNTQTQDRMMSLWLKILQRESLAVIRRHQLAYVHGCVWVNWALSPKQTHSWDVYDSD